MAESEFGVMATTIVLAGELAICLGVAHAVMEINKTLPKTPVAEVSSVWAQAASAQPVQAQQPQAQPVYNWTPPQPTWTQQRPQPMHTMPSYRAPY